MASESHARQMQVFSQRSGAYIDEFSRQFEASYMRLMRTRYCRQRVLANTVYCDMIGDKEHTHMNATVWVTLNGFVRHLESSGQCQVDWTARGPFVTYIDKEREIREKEAARNLKVLKSGELLEAERLKKAIEVVREQDAEGLAEKTEKAGTIDVSKLGSLRMSFAPKNGSEKNGSKPKEISVVAGSNAADKDGEKTRPKNLTASLFGGHDDEDLKKKLKKEAAALAASKKGVSVLDKLMSAQPSKKLRQGF